MQLDYQLLIHSMKSKLVSLIFLFLVIHINDISKVKRFNNVYTFIEIKRNKMHVIRFTSQ